MRRTCVFVFLLAGGLACLAAGLHSAPAPFEARPAREVSVAGEWGRLQGVWEVVRFECDGEQEEEIVGLPVAFAPGKLRFPGNPEMDCQIDPAGRPRRFDASSKATDTFPLDVAVHGIYKLEGDTLTLCYRPRKDDGPRPTEFRTDEERGALMVLKRAGREGK